jgi:DDE family transposase/uncharacterized protein DUF4372
VANYNTVLNDLLNQFPRYEFDRAVQTMGGDRYVKKLSTWNQFTVLLYAQASGKSSLREIENGLLLRSNRAYHLGLPGKIARSTLADANGRRDWKIYQGLFYAMLDRCRNLTPARKFRFKNPLYSLDSTTIELALSAFPWAKFSKQRGAIKLHYQLDNASNLPVFMTLTEGTRQDMPVAAEEIEIIPDSIYCFDRGYSSFEWFRRITDEGAFFVTRAKNNMAASYLGQQEKPLGKGVLTDIVVKTTSQRGRKYPYPLRLISFYDSETKQYFEFLTNNFKLAATTIASIYKARWQIEIFFKWIKYNLKIKSFLGTSKNAVLTQVWVAMCYYLVLAYVKYQSRYKNSLFYFHRVIKETLLEPASILDLLRLNDARLKRLITQEPQLCLQL